MFLYVVMCVFVFVCVFVNVYYPLTKIIILLEGMCVMKCIPH